MSTPFLGEIRTFAGNFAPKGWASCSGQLLSIAQNNALFSLLGTDYGGDGITTFALPDLRGRAVIGQGQGPGLSPYSVGQQTGAETVTLIVSQIPSHTHDVRAFTAAATSPDPSGLALAQPGDANPEAPQVGKSLFYLNPAIGSPNTAALPADTIQPAGGSQPHENMSPYLALFYIIALQGIFPSRN